ncbi:MAG: NAD(P)/FAD-dependent oxidoreductase [candidate division Zixibacteria bacterium]|nr:NAD(P)/FAD-dependent oxidoreductase [candidate division Zixibacteria bacterium]
MSDKLYDITITGAGPVGLFAAYYSGLRDLCTKIIDHLPQIGGQLTTLYPQKYIYDVAGFPKVLASELAENLLRQAQQYKPAICLGQRVQKLSYSDDGRITLATESGEKHLTKKVVLTAGAGVFTPRKLEAPGVEKFMDRGFHYLVTDPGMFKNKKLLIIGGGDTALDWAVFFKGTAQKVTLMHRTNKFVAAPSSVKHIMDSQVELLTFFELKEIRGNSHPESAVVVNSASKEEKEIEIDSVLCCIGFTPNLGPIKEWGLDLQGSSIKVNHKMETNLPGVYAAGDVASYEGKLRLICTGFSEAATAVNHAAHAINPDLRVFPGYSTNLAEKKSQQVVG